MTSSPEGGRGGKPKDDKWWHDDRGGGGTTKDDNPRNQSLDLLLNYTWSFKEYVGGYLSRRFWTGKNTLLSNIIHQGPGRFQQPL